MYNVKRVSGVVLLFLIVGLIYHKEAFSHGAKRSIPEAEGRSITAKVWLPARIAAHAGVPLQLRSSFLLHLALPRSLFALLSRYPATWSSILLDLVHRCRRTVHCSVELR